MGAPLHFVTLRRDTAVPSRPAVHKLSTTAREGALSRAAGVFAWFIDKLVEEVARAGRAPKSIGAWERPWGGPTMIRRAVVTLAAVALTAGVFVSGASAAPPLCGSKPCAEEIGSACGAFTGADFRACKKSVTEQCEISGETFCSCTNPALPPCTPPTTTTSTTTTTTCGSLGTPCCGGTTCFSGLGCSGGFCTLCPTTSTTTTLPLCDPVDPACLANGVCTNGQTCGLDTNGLCACVGPPPTCGQWGIITCGGTCPAGEQCALESIAPPGCPQVPVCHCVPAP